MEFTCTIQKKHILEPIVEGDYRELGRQTGFCKKQLHSILYLLPINKVYEGARKVEESRRLGWLRSMLDIAHKTCIFIALQQV
jgi:hypothetical protein